MMFPLDTILDSSGKKDMSKAMNSTERSLTLGSLFDGSGGFPLGGLLSGITPVWASEIEPFPIRVTTKRLPFMKHYGDISRMDGGKVEPVDIITFGSPCTDMSFAGRRAGLDGQQSVLFYQAIRIIKEMRCATNGKYPKYCVWENVPGAFSSNGGKDFKAVLEAVIGITEPGAQVPMPKKAQWPYADCYMGDGWSVAYRVFDAQYWGVPQRRKRIYLVADFTGRSAFDILFKSEGLSGYSAEGIRAWQRTAGNAAYCTAATGFDGYNGCLTNDVSATIGVNCGMSTGRNGIVLNDQGGQRMSVTEDITGTICAESHHPPCVLESAGFSTEPSSKSRSIGYEKEISPTLRAGAVPAAVYENHSQDTRCTGPVNKDSHSASIPCTWDGQQTVPTLTTRNAGGNQRMPDTGQFNCVLQAYSISSKESNAMKSNNPHSGIYAADTSRTIDCNGSNPRSSQGGIAVVESYAIQGSMIGRSDKNGPQGDGINDDVSFTLNTVDRHAVYAMTTGSFTQVTQDTSPTLTARDFKDPNTVCYGIGRDTFNQGKNANAPGAIQSGYTVRRLTPTECARLQGFPDWWCADLGTAEPTMDDIRYWYDVFETHRKIVGTSTKPKTIKQIEKWLKSPHSDTAEYKMWGNGVCLNIVVMIMCGIRWAANKES